MSTQPQPVPEPPRSRPARWRVWAMAVRPRTLGASLVPVAVGSAVAAHEGAVRIDVLLVCLAAALGLQVTANLVNDAADFLRGIDGVARIGPARVTQTGLLPAPRVLRAAALCLVIALALGVYLVWLGGWPILAIGLAAALAALGYSAGPFPLAAHALGELGAFLFFGLAAVVGTAYLHTDSVAPLAWLAALPVGALVSNLMLVNNLRDIQSDRVAGKRTLAVRLGAEATRTFYLVALTGAFMIPFLLWLREPAHPSLLLPGLAAPLAIRAARCVRRAADPESFQRALATTAGLHAVFGALLICGLLA